MPLGLLIDVKGSQELEIEKRGAIINKMEKGRQLLMEFPKNLIPIEPAITGGDMLEIIATKWYPLTYLFHIFLRIDIPFRSGLGTGTIHLKKETVDKSDGPVLWSARKALNHAKRRHHKINLEFGRDTTEKDRLDAFTAYLTIGMILNMTRMQREYSFAWIWNGKKITKISKETNKSKAAISTTLKRANAYILHDLLKLHSTPPRIFPSLDKVNPSTKTINDHITYITDSNIQKAAKEFLNQVKTWEGVELIPITSHISMKVHEEVFAYFTPRQEYFQIRSYKGGGTQWETIAEVKSQEDVRKALQKTKKIYKQTE